MNANEAKSLIGDVLWHNTNIGSLEVSDFEKLDSVVSKITDPDDLTEFRNMCETEINSNTKVPVAINYLASVCGRHPIDDSHIFAILELYYDMRLWNQTIFIAKRILSFNESSYALRVLADCYETLGKTEEKIAVWERLIKTDYDATEVVFALGEYYEGKGELISALSYYTRVLKRHVKSSDLTSIKAVWEKITALKSDSPDYIFDFAIKIASELDRNKSMCFLLFVIDSSSFDVNSSIEIYKKILELDSHNALVKDKLIELYRQKYKDNIRLEYCLSDTGLLQSYIDCNIAIEKFEKEVEFIPGAFVYHESFGVGIIKEIDKDNISIVFTKGGARKMALSMAYSGLVVKPKTDLSVLKACAPADKLSEKFQNNVEWGLKTILSSNAGKCSFDRIKTELCPSEKEKALGIKGILTDSQWSVWQKAAKEILRTDPYFSMYKEDKKDICVLRKTPITNEEKQLILFRSEKDFYSKVKILRDFISNNNDINSDEFQSMINYFEGKSQSREFESVSSFLLLSYLKQKIGIGFVTIKYTFSDYYDSLVARNAVKDYFSSVQDAEFKRLFVDNVMICDKNWQEILVDLFPVWMTSYMSDCIKSGSNKKRFSELLSDSIANCRMQPDFFIYLTKNSTVKELAKAGYTEDQVLEAKLKLLAFLSGKIANDIDATENKAIAKKLTDMLFRNGEVQKALKKSDESGVRRYYSMVNSIEGDLFAEERKLIEDFIKKNFDFADSIIAVHEDKTEPVKSVFPTKLLCTYAMLKVKNEEYTYLKDVELPQNSKDIGEAKALGDLRENSEYQYAKDKRKELNARLDTLSEQLVNAQPVKPEDVNTKYIGFGTVCNLRNNITGKEISYTIMGPWESDPDKNVLNFQAPLGKELYSLEEGQSKKFSINGEPYDITVLSISLADFK